MFYRLLINYFRIQLIRMILTHLTAHLKSKNSSKVIKIVPYLELLFNHYANRKMRK